MEVHEYSDDDYNYDIRHPHRGKVLIFQNRKFRGDRMPPLKYSDADYSYLFGPLKKAGFDVERCRDFKRNDVIKKLEETAQDDMHKDADMFMCIFLTYGDGYQGLVHASDCAITVDEIQGPFMGDKCKTLLGKPKYFVFQAHEYGSKTEADDGEDDDNLPLSQTVPADADFLLYWSTMKDDTYFWDGKRNKGTLFSRSMSFELAEMIEKNDGLDFKELFYGTSGRVTRQLESHYPQQLEADDKLLPVIEDSLTKFYPFAAKVTS